MRSTPDVLKEIGDTTLFLIIVAVIGTSYTAKELYRGRCQVTFEVLTFSMLVITRIAILIDRPLYVG